MRPLMFELLLNLGVGSQREGDFSAIGLAGLNLGVGGFLTENLALMFRLSGTNATHEFGAFGYDFDISQVSGVAGLTVQHWLDDRFYIEAGPGMGFWSCALGFSWTLDCERVLAGGVSR